MELKFKDADLEKIEIDANFDAGYQQAIVKALRKRIQQIRAAIDERDFYHLNSLKFEKLKGTRSHQYSMRLNDQWRLIIEFEGNSTNKVVIIICIDDYH